MRTSCASASLVLATAVMVATAAGALAQGTQISTISGTVSSQDGALLPGVTVTVLSEAIQGDRTAVTDTNGSYIVRGLALGEYTVVFELDGFAKLERKLTLALGTALDISATLQVAGVQETIAVTGTAPTALETTQVSANYRGEDIDKLATGRTIQNIAALAPGLTTNTPNAGQVTVAGGFAYDNVFLLNGVDINDNLFGTANNLFIEDAIEEVQTLTNAISAEYGRFSGGVINAVTKRGSNTLQGSFRIDFTNPTWSDKSPYEEENDIKLTDKTSRYYQATLGGPVVKDRLWFFLAGRTEEATTTETFSYTGISYDRINENDRYEIKLTASINPNHTVQGTFTNNKTAQTQPTFGFSIDPRTIVNRTLPNKLWVVDYSGVLSSSVFIEARYSEKRFGFRDSGGTSTDVLDSPFLARGRAGLPANSHYNAPYFDSTDPEDRNNRQFAGAVSYFLSTGNAGRHDLKVGVEHFTSTRTGGNSQTATGYVFITDPVVVGGAPEFGSDGRIIPSFVPNVSILNNWLPTRGAQIDIRTLSLYLNDRWTLSSHWSFNLGVRFEDIKSEATSVSKPPSSTSIVPRLGVTWDVKGDGKHRVYASYAHYSGKASETQFADTSPVGTPSLVQGLYTGPAGSGMNFAAGFDPANYRTVGGNFPLENVFFGDSLGTPVSKEITIGYGIRLGNRGELRADYAQRSISSFLDDFITIDNGTTTVVVDGITYGTFDNVVIRNTDDPVRDYQGLTIQGSYRVTDDWRLYANYTHQFKNEGNFEGEGTNTPGSYSIFGDRPEILGLERLNPNGNLNDYQKHKVRAWTTYDLRLGKAGNITLGALYSYDSSQSYSLTASAVPISSIQRSRDPGYARPPTSQTVYFGARGSEEYGNSLHILDFTLNYDIPIYKSLRPWVKLELRNAFNNDTLYTYNTTISAVTTGPVDADGLPTTYTKGSNFGKGTGNANYATPRTFQFSVGVRF